MNTWRNALLTMSLALLAGVAIAGAAEPTAAKVELDIEPQPVGDALNQFAAQTGLQVVLFAEVSAGIVAPGISGSYSPAAALERLLEKTGLRYEYLNERTIAIRAKGAGKEAAALQEGSQRSVGGEPIRVAQSDAGAAGSGGESEGESAGEDKREGAELEEVVVTGTHIRGVKETAQPSFSITREEIDNAGFNTVEELVEKLPQNFNSVTPLSQAAGNLSNNTVATENGTRVTAIDLRGLGAESTLTLINGRRRAGSVYGRVVDVSAIPLSAIERVDVVTGGASAIYGADAVAGVVNIITRHGFNGIESRVAYGSPTGYDGGDFLQASLLGGEVFENASWVAAYDYEQREASNLLGTGHHSSTRLPNGRRYLYSPLEADVRRHSAYVAGQLMLSDRAELYGDFFYTDKGVKKQDEIFFNSSDGVEASRPSRLVTAVPAESYGAAVGVKIDAGAGWSLDMGGAYSYTNSQYEKSADYAFVDPAFDFTSLANEYRNEAVISGFTIIVDGPLPSILGITPRAALGAEFRKEEFTHASTYEEISTATGESLFSVNTNTNPADRHLHSAFVELNLPLVAEGRPGLRRLELSLGARHDEYNDFGGSFNWTSGLTWQPGAGLTLRGSYATAMRAPSIHDTSGALGGDSSFNNFTFWEGPDPTQAGATTPLLILLGTAPLEPEEATSWSLGLDYAPELASWAKLSFSWFSIDYEDRLERPLQFDQLPLWLTFGSALAGITTRDPTVAQVQALLDARSSSGVHFIPDGSGGFTTLPADAGAQQVLDALPGLVIVDNRYQNLAVETIEGLDLEFNSDFATPLGRIDLGIDGTYTLDHDRRVTTTSPAISRLDSVALPTGWRLRGHLGWSAGAWGTDVYINYIPGYDNPFPPPTGVVYAPKVSSWTTADLTLRFNAGNREGSDFLDGIGVTLAVSNLFNAKPPFWSGSSSLGRDFDAANANPVGRFMTLGVIKQW